MNFLTDMMPSNPSVVIYLYLIADIEIYTTLSYSWDMHPLPIGLHNSSDDKESW